ncbi:exocyst complex component 6B-like isoform X1 [Labeo rohita]|uniref:Exocyst complex component 6B-like isoform X1 n=1 Tax=Labeo rohita TaxID=84645 RepID=A0A498MPW7_LABRO|nr:exocyst complex component 6B-like isoform X1 [Labeo rohita]
MLFFYEKIRTTSGHHHTNQNIKAQVQIARDNAVTSQQRSVSGRRIRKEVCSVLMYFSLTFVFCFFCFFVLQIPGAQDLVDFSPVYRCLHIYTVLYRPVRPGTISVELLRSDRKLNSSWKVKPRDGKNKDGVREQDKEEGARDTFENYYRKQRRKQARLVLQPHSNMHETLEGYRRYFNQIVGQILDQDNYSPIPVASPEEYQRIAGQFPFQDPELDKMPFPKKLPFSEFVPKVYSQLKEFIYACLKYSEDLHLSSTEIDDMIRKSTNLLLTRTLSHCLQYAIKKKNVGLAELVQIIINTTHLEQSCHYLEEFISNITNVPPDTINATKLYGTSTFKDARHAAEEEIYTNLNQKIDQFLQLADYDWTAAQGGGQASDYLSDLIAFLCSTFAVFTHLPGNAIEHATLPGKVAQTACMSACKHLSTSLLQLLLEADVRQVSMGALQQFNVDVKECEKWRSRLFTGSRPKAQKGPMALRNLYNSCAPHTPPAHWLFTSFVGPFAQYHATGLGERPHGNRRQVLGYGAWPDIHLGGFVFTIVVRRWPQDLLLFALRAGVVYRKRWPENTKLKRTEKTIKGVRQDLKSEPLTPYHFTFHSDQSRTRGYAPARGHFPQVSMTASPLHNLRDNSSLSEEDRKLLDLFTQWDWSTYLADYGRPTCKYLRVNPHTALALLEKMKDTSRKNNMFAQFRKNERDKQKLIDTVVKQLRNLIATNQA